MNYNLGKLEKNVSKNMSNKVEIFKSTFRRNIK